MTDQRPQVGKTSYSWCPFRWREVLAEPVFNVLHITSGRIREEGSQGAFLRFWMAGVVICPQSEHGGEVCAREL